MADQLQLRGGTTNEHSTFTGALREVTVDTDKDTLIVHDAATAGGHPLLREDGSNSALALGTAGTPSIKFTGDTNTGIYSPGADQVAISTGGSNRLHIAADGKIGVGTTSPATPLDLVMDSVSGIKFDVRSGGGSEITTYQGSSNSNVRAFQVNCSQFVVETGAVTGTATTEALRITSDGKVGVGTSSPQQALHLSTSTAPVFRIESRDTVVDTGESIGKVEFYSNDASTGGVGIGANIDCVAENPGTLYGLRFSTGAPGSSSPKLAITWDGKVGVGTTSPARLLHLQSSSGGGMFTVERTSATTSALVIAADPGEIKLFGRDTNSGSTAVPIVFMRGGSDESMRIDSSGRVGVGTSSPSTYNAKLAVYGTDQDGTRIALFRSGNAGTSISVDGGLVFGADGSTGGTARMKISNTGNVGVGTTSPDSKVEIRAATDTTEEVFKITNSSDNNNIVVRQEGSSGYAIRSSLDLRFDADYDNNTGDTGSNILFRTDGSEKVRIDPSGRVGIGTSSPSQKLHIDESASNSYATMRLSGTNRGGIVEMYSDASPVAQFGSDQSGNIFVKSSLGFQQPDVHDVVYINTSGNVGIGTTSPGLPLDVVSNASSETVRFRGASGGIGTLRFTSNDGATNYSFIQSRSTYFDLGTDASIPLLFSTAGTERARITSAGRLLIGTSTARGNYYGSTGTYYPRIQNEATSLATSMISNVTNSNDTYGAYLILGKSRGTSAGSYTVVQNGDSLGSIDFHGADGFQLEHAARIGAEVDGPPGDNDMPGRLVFHTCPDGSTGTQERMRITNKGFFKATNNNVYDSSTGEYHEFNSSKNDNYTLVIADRSSNPYGLAIRYRSVTPDGSSYYFIDASDTTTTRFRVRSDGDVLNHDNTYGALSDQKLKQDIVDAGSQWDDLKNLRVRKFKFISDVEAYGDNAKTLIGLVAQEAETVSPGLVKDNPDLDDENNDLGTVTKTVNYSVLYMKAIKALQEAMDRIETLEAKVAALEAN